MPRSFAVLIVLTGLLAGCGTGSSRTLASEASPAFSEPPVPRFMTSVGMEFVFIPGGTFTMGGSAREAQPKHQVTLSPFYVARHVVTKGLYVRFLKATGHQYAEHGDDNVFADEQLNLDVPFTSHQEWMKLPPNYVNAPTKDHEFWNASYSDAKAFADWLSKVENRPFQVITEAQAEYILRSGVAKDDEEFWWQSLQPSSVGCWLEFGANPINTGPAIGAGFPGLYAMTPWGLYLEVSTFWTQDRYRDGYSSEAQVDPTGPKKGEEDLRATRGMWLNRSFSRESSATSSILIISPVQLSDHHPWSESPEPNVTPIPVTALERSELSLRDDITLSMRKIPAGTFVMGRPESFRSWTFEWPETTFTMKDYWLGETEVTQAQFRSVTGINPSLYKGDDLPVHSVTMGEMLAFCDLLTARERAAGRLGMDEEYRLPTEAEWERAARAGTNTHWSCGNDPNVLRKYAWFDQIGMMAPQAVAKKWPNPWGFFDMEGNVFERCCEHKFNYPGGMRDLHWIKADVLLPGPGWNSSTNWHVVRGGSFNMGAIACEPTIRRTMHAQSRVAHIGFRLARGPVLPTWDPKVYNPDAFVFDRSGFENGQDYRSIMEAHGKTSGRNGE